MSGHTRRCLNQPQPDAECICDDRPLGHSDGEAREHERMASETRDLRAEIKRLKAELADTTRALHEKCTSCEVGRSLEAKVERLRELIALLLPKADAFWRAGEVRPAWMREAREALGEVET